jgi:hypothetical protein
MVAELDDGAPSSKPGTFKDLADQWIEVMALP